MAAIEEIAQAEKRYVDVTARSECVEFIDKSLSVKERLIDIGSCPASLARKLIRIRRFMEETGQPPIIRLQHAPVFTTDIAKCDGLQDSRPTRRRDIELAC